MKIRWERLLPATLRLRLTIHRLEKDRSALLRDLEAETAALHARKASRDEIEDVSGSMHNDVAWIDEELDPAETELLILRARTYAVEYPLRSPKYDSYGDWTDDNWEQTRFRTGAFLKSQVFQQVEFKVMRAEMAWHGELRTFVITLITALSGLAAVIAGAIAIWASSVTDRSCQ